MEPEDFRGEKERSLALKNGFLGLVVGDLATVSGPSL